MTYADSNPSRSARGPVIPDPVQSRSLPSRVKMQAVIGLERAVYPIFVVGFIALMIGLSLGPGRRGAHLVDAKTSQMIGLGVGGGIVLGAGLLWLLNPGRATRRKKRSD